MSQETSPEPESLPQDKKLGVVVSGSLSRGLEVKLGGVVSVEDMAVGRYVTIYGTRLVFLGMITDVSLESLNQRLPFSSLDFSDPFISEVMAGTGVFGVVRVLPLLTLSGEVSSLLQGPQPVKTIPPHFSPVKAASQRDIELVFGPEDEKRFYIGNPLDIETKVCLDLEELVKRSNGIFGKSGTGKTFLTRMLLIGMVQKGVAANLVFDMHSEYGWEGTAEGGRKVKALKQLFPSRVAIFALDRENVRRRRVGADVIVEIGYNEIEPEDIEMLRQTLGLTDASVQAVYLFAREFGEGKWLEHVLGLKTDEEARELLARLNVHESTYRNLRRGLSVLKRLPFLIPRSSANVVERVLEYLERGISVVLEFGRYTDIAAYVLVANLLSRRIYLRYRERMEEAMGGGASSPYPLNIVIEEAHKFLNPEVSQQTIFGTIAREMRKYNVTLLVIDQRPSGIDEEVMSQLGTKITCLLDNERDIESVLTGVPGKSELKGVLSKLESRQQALVFGHAVPMPVVVRVREYGSAESYQQLGAAGSRKSAEGDIKDLWE